jgi:transcriptional regulator GlxA family with amidase domain
MFPAVTVDPLGPGVRAGSTLSCGLDAANPRLVSELIAQAFGTDSARNLLHREPASLDTREQAGADPIVAEAKLWMHERFARDFRIGDLAAVLGISHQTLLRRFRAAGEGGPRAYTQKVRAETAAIMLTETRRSIAEIAQLVGYADVASFRQMFQQRMGMTPGDYRRRASSLSGENRE